MTKRNFLSGFKAVLTGTEPPAWGRRLAVADEAVAAAEREHGSAALAVEQQVPGAAARLVDAVQALQAARARKNDLTAAQATWNAQEADRRGKLAAAEAEKQDKAARAAFDTQAAIAREGEAIIAAYAKWWERMMVANDDCRAQATTNPRVRQDLDNQNLEVLVKREISRVATTTTLPPGSDRMAPMLSDKREWPSLADTFEALAATACPDSAQPKRSCPPR